MASDIHWLGVSEFRAALDRLISETSRETRNAVGEGAALIQRGAMERSPVVTGTLRRSIQVDPLHPYGADGWQTQIGPTIVYGRRVELGFHAKDALGRKYDQPGRPYFTPAYMAAVPRLPGIFAKHWSSALTRI